MDYAVNDYNKNGHIIPLLILHLKSLQINGTDSPHVLKYFK